MRRIPITHGAQPGWVYLRELRGDDEESISDVDTWAAIALIDRLLVDAPGALLRPGQAVALTAADRDRALAAIHGAELGDRIATTVSCSACGARFDLDFRLGELVAALTPDLAGVTRDGAGGYRLADGTCFRLPTGLDELEAAGAPSPTDALVARCRLAGDADAATLAAALERVAPLVDVELDASCAECGHVQPVRFDVQRYLLGSLLADGPQRAAEIHRLARSYGWGLAEILSLPRRRRRDYVALVEREGAR